MPGVAAFDLASRTALVTGSSRGIGLALAEGLAEAGATVVLNGVDPVRLDKTRDELAASFGEDRVHARAFDIVDEAAVTSAVASVEAEFGGLDPHRDDPEARRRRGFQRLGPRPHTRRSLGARWPISSAPSSGWHRVRPTS
jgi:short chain dehydrogenase